MVVTVKAERLVSDQLPDLRRRTSDRRQRAGSSPSFIGDKARRHPHSKQGDRKRRSPSVVGSILRMGKPLVAMLPKIGEKRVVEPAKTAVFHFVLAGPASRNGAEKNTPSRRHAVVENSGQLHRVNRYGVHNGLQDRLLTHQCSDTPTNQISYIPKTYRYVGVS